MEILEFPTLCQGWEGSETGHGVESVVQANFSTFFPIQFVAWHVPSRGWVWEKRGFRGGSSNTKGNQNFLYEGEVVGAMC